MASVKYGSIVTEIKGKVGGQTFQSNKAGFSLKNNGQNPKVSVRGWDLVSVTRKSNFSSVTKLWSTLSDAERNAWNGLSGTWLFVNKFGDSYAASGYQIFCAANINRKLLGLSILTTAPTYNAAVDPMWSFSDFSVAGDFTETRGNAAAIGMRTFNQLTYLTTPTKSFNTTRILGSNASFIASAGTTSIKAGIVAALGGMPAVGTIFYITKWFCWADYPKQQFYQVYKIKVVA